MTVTVPDVLYSLHRATIFYNTALCVHLEDMVGNISYFKCGKMWRNCTESFVKFCGLLLVTQ